MSLSTTRGHLSAVADDPGGLAELPALAAHVQQSAGEVLRLAAGLATTQRPGRVRLTDWQRMEVEQARKLLMDAPELFATRPDAYVAGLIEGAASNLLDIIDAVTEV